MQQRKGFEAGKFQQHISLAWFPGLFGLEFVGDIITLSS
ncbi:hypothetical protein ES332_A02G140100v1 [Gossypium tomentosum]|uniref:Uncharacterized protein n=1 Tax=Gossypium tomentosum TaxID=34277 RepID=A0A5D2RI27_GOSTO|nr:hypothetical protein ES332_1Z001800v1 [Gossypium tomentosum]TYI40103.1 hypothetical protein ES332_A02G140100v1 [Gossypium tomentosum]